VLFGGGLAGRYGRKGIFMAGMGLFAAASVAAAASTDVWQLIGSRAARGPPRVHPRVGGSLYAVAGTLFGAGAAFVAPPGTTAIMNALPTTKAGDGSAVNQVTRQVGSPLGAAVAGTVLAGVYVRELTPSLGSMPADARSTAEASISGAQKVAASPHSESLVHAADSAFSSCFQVAMLVSAIFAFGTAIVVALVLRHEPATGDGRER
jgi:MFS family permease